MNLVTTNLLREVSAGNREVVDQLFSILYEDLCVRAGAALRRESIEHTLQPAALVNEAYLRMIDQRKVHWRDRAHFCNIASIAMRRILVDHARKKKSARRGGDAQRVTLDPDTATLSPQEPDDVLFVHQLIEKLDAQDPVQAKIVQLRFFGAMTVAEVAEVLEMPKRSVEAEWSMIRATIRAKLSRGIDVIP